MPIFILLTGSSKQFRNYVRIMDFTNLLFDQIGFFYNNKLRSVILKFLKILICNLEFGHFVLKNTSRQATNFVKFKIHSFCIGCWIIDSGFQHKVTKSQNFMLLCFYDIFMVIICSVLSNIQIMDPATNTETMNLEFYEICCLS